MVRRDVRFALSREIHFRSEIWAGELGHRLRSWALRRVFAIKPAVKAGPGGKPCPLTPATLPLYRPIEAPVLNRLGHVSGGDVVLAGEIRDRARNPQDAGVRPRREAEAFRGDREQAAAVGATVAISVSMGTMASCVSGAEMVVSMRASVRGVTPSHSARP